MVERSVRDAEAASSNLVASTIRPIGQAVKTEPSHGSNPGSIPGSVTGMAENHIGFLLFSYPACRGDSAAQTAVRLRQKGITDG